MIDRELLYDAFYAYEALAGLGGMTDKHKEAYKKLREALTQPKKEWVGLTDEEKKAIYEKADSENWHDQPLLEAVEAKLKEKNA